MNGVSEEVPVLRLHCACGTGSLTRIGHGLTSVTPRRPTTSSSVDLFSIGSHTERAGRRRDDLRTEPTHRDALTHTHSHAPDQTRLERQDTPPGPRESWGASSLSSRAALSTPGPALGGRYRGRVRLSIVRS